MQQTGEWHRSLWEWVRMCGWSETRSHVLDQRKLRCRNQGYHSEWKRQQRTTGDVYLVQACSVPGTATVSRSLSISLFNRFLLKRTETATISSCTPLTFRSSLFSTPFLSLFRSAPNPCSLLVKVLEPSQPSKASMCLPMHSSWSNGSLEREWEPTSLSLLLGMKSITQVHICHTTVSAVL